MATTDGPATPQHNLPDAAPVLFGRGAEQALFARLSVFAGGWTAEEGLASLVEQSLVLPAREGQYGMLETVREYAAYALARLSAEENEGAVRRQHLAYYLALAEGAAQLTGPDQPRWLSRLEEAHDNFRAALAWGLRGAGDRLQALRLATALWRFWDIRAYLREGRGWLEEALSLASAASPLERAGALNGAGNLENVAKALEDTAVLLLALGEHRLRIHHGAGPGAPGRGGARGGLGRGASAPTGGSRRSRAGESRRDRICAGGLTWSGR